MEPELPAGSIWGQVRGDETTEYHELNVIPEQVVVVMP